MFVNQRRSFHGRCQGNDGCIVLAASRDCRRGDRGQNDRVRSRPFFGGHRPTIVTSMLLTVGLAAAGCTTRTDSATPSSDSVVETAVPDPDVEHLSARCGHDGGADIVDLVLVHLDIVHDDVLHHPDDHPIDDHPTTTSPTTIRRPGANPGSGPVRLHPGG